MPIKPRHEIPSLPVEGVEWNRVPHQVITTGRLLFRSVKCVAIRSVIHRDRTFHSNFIILSPLIEWPQRI